jgi:catechol 2,3-dioxygenase-like lactoylglutathione lyase family enzyme
MSCAISRLVDISTKEPHPWRTPHVAVYVRSIPEAVEQYRKVLGIEPAKVHHDYAKFELADPPVIFSLNVGGEPGTLSHLGIRYSGTGEVASEMARTKHAEVPLFQQAGTTCCYAKADKYWVKDADGIPWEMYTLLADVEAETAADRELRTFLGQQAGEPTASTAGGCVPPARA